MKLGKEQIARAIIHLSLEINLIDLLLSLRQQTLLNLSQLNRPLSVIPTLSPGNFKLLSKVKQDNIHLDLNTSLEMSEKRKQIKTKM